MKYVRHIGLFVAGGACVVGGLFFPPAAAILGALGTKLIVASGAAMLFGTSTDVLTSAVKDAATAVKKPKA